MSTLLEFGGHGRNDDVRVVFRSHSVADCLAFRQYDIAATATGANPMTPTTNERNRFEAWAKDTMSLVKEPGGYKEATTHHAWRAWQAALTREQREGDAVEPIMCRECGQPTMHLGSLCFRCSKAHKPQQEAPAITQCPKCDCWFEPPGTPTSLPNGSLLKSMTVQQEAPGVDDEAARKAVGDVFKSLPNSGPIKHHGRFG